MNQLQLPVGPLTVCAVAALMVVQGCLAAALCWALDRKRRGERRIAELADENDVLRQRLHGCRLRGLGMLDAVRAMNTPLRPQEIEGREEGR